MAYSPTESTTIRVTTDFGLDTNYEATLINEDVIVDASNYKDDAYQTTVVSTGDIQRGTITNNDVYKMLNVALPSDLTNTYTAANGITYQYKITATNGTSSLSERNIIYTTTWGIGNYNNTWETTTTLKLTTSNYNTADITTTYRTTQETATKNYLDTLIGTFSAPTAVTETYSDAPNGITYYIKTTFSGSNSSITATSGTLTATTTWGTSSGTYDHSFTDGNTNSVSVTSSNFTNRETLVANIGTTQRTNLKNYLDTLIGAVSTPSDSTTTFSTASGQTFYVKTTFTGSNNTEVATSCDIKYTTVYGLTNSYGTTYSSNVTFTVTPDNYTSWTTELASAVSTEQAKIKNLDSYKMLNLALPGVLTNTNFVATNGVTYQYKVTATNGTASLTERNIVYTSTWGVGNYNNIWATKHTLTLTTSNYSTANITTANRTIQVTNTEDYLNTLISTVTTPGDITTTFSTASGQTFYVKTTATGSNSSITATSCTIKYTTVYGLTNSYGNTLSTNVEFTVDANNYTSWTTSYASTVASEQDKVKNLATYKMLNIALPSVVTNTNFVATNGITYQYKVTPSYGTCNLTKSEIIYTTTWGVGNYNNTWATKHKLTLTTSNYSTSNITTTNRTIQVTNTEDYLNTLIGTVVKPADKTTTFSTNSGQIFYVKTTFSGGNSSVSATGTTITYTTVYGLTNSYGNTLSTNVEFEVTSDNYTTWESDINTAATTEQDKVKNLDSYKMLNIALPGDHNDTYTAVNGKSYSFTTTYTQGTANLTQNNITCTTKYTRQDKTVKTYNSTTRKFTTSNYSAASNNLASDMSTLEQNLKDYLDTLLVMPTKYSNTYTKGGCKYYFEIYYTIPDEESHDVTATAKVDLLTLKSSTVTCTDMSDFNTKKTSMQSTKISEMENAVSDSPLNTSTTVQELTIATSYTKNAITSSSVDGNIYGSVDISGSVVYGPINFGKLTTFTNYKFVYTTIVNNINTKVSEITDILNNSLPVSGSYTYQSTDNFGCKIDYAYTRNVLLYSLSISIDGVNMHDETQYLNINEAFKIDSRMKYLLAKYESMIKNVTPVDIEETYNGVTVARKFSKNPESNKVTCELYVDGVKKYTYTGTFDLSQSVLKENLQSLGEGDYDQYLSNAKSLNISVSTTTTITSNGRNYNVYILTEKVGSKIRVYRVIGNMKTNYIDVDINYLNANTTKTAIQTAANRLISNLNTAIDFYRPPSEAALVELLKVITA